MKKKTICVQGIGFVGAAMISVLADAKNNENKYLYNLIGVDLKNKIGQERIDKINLGLFPFETKDKKIKKSLSLARKQKRLFATTDTQYFSKADIIIIDTHLDLKAFNKSINKSNFVRGIIEVFKFIKPKTLLLIESTIPPGMTEKVLLPEIKKILKKRKLKLEDIFLAHSYERVMPGLNYFNSIKEYWRVYAGINKTSADNCEKFLKTFINTKKYELTRLENIRSSELAKILENTYRAVTISLMDEWSKFADSINIDLYQVSDAIRKRTTHSNIRYPGLGVGGYCLTKDPKFAEISAKKIFKLKNMPFPISNYSVRINNKMPDHAFSIIKKNYGNKLKEISVLIMGLSYLADVSDTRFSPSEILYNKLCNNVKSIFLHDPLVSYWKEKEINIPNDLPDFSKINLVVLAVKHKSYTTMNYLPILKKNKNLVIFDVNCVLIKEKVLELRKKGFKILTLGR